jgi:hypothetical protein
MAVRRQRKLMGHAILRHAHPGREALPLVLLPKRIAALHHRLASAPVHSMPGWLRAFMLFGFHRQRPSCKDVDLLPGRPTSQERGRSDIYSETGISKTSVQRYFQLFGLQPHRSEGFKLSTDPFFIEKLRDVVGLYLSPPENALVLCVDEKSQCQALERTQPMLPMGFGYVEGVTHDYKRHGTTTLFAALNVLNGAVLATCKPRHRHRVPGLLARDRQNGSTRVGHPLHRRQLRHPQSSDDQGLAGQPPSMAPALHSDLQLVAQPSRTILRTDYGQSHPPWLLHQRQTTRAAH